MTLGTFRFASLALVSVPILLWGLHRLALRMERNGWIYYTHRKPTGGGGHLGPFQEIVDPPAKHVWQIREHTRSHSETDVPGQGDPPPIMRDRSAP
jgi:hypothetical protein